MVLSQAAGNIFASIDRSRDLFRWDASAHKFVADNRFALPVDAPDATMYLQAVDPANAGENAPFWSFTNSTDGRRVGLFSKQPDGSWHVDEDSYRRLTRYSIVILRSEPNGAVWITGDKLVRLTPQKDRTPPQPFRTVVRQVNAGSQGGLRGHQH